VAEYNAIAAVSEALLETLQVGIAERSDVISLSESEIVLDSPDNVGDEADTRLSLFLYDVERSTNRQHRTINENNVRSGRPLSLKLHYLLTAYPSSAGTSETASTSDQHHAFGLALQVLHDNGILTGEALGDSFDDDTKLTVKMDSEDGTIPRIWDSFRDVPLQPSVTYTVETVHIESRREERVTRVTERSFETERDDVPDTHD